MPLDCKDFLDGYFVWLKERYTFVEFGTTCEITTPFLDRHNDRLQIYVESTESGGIRITDDG